MKIFKTPFIYFFIMVLALSRQVNAQTYLKNFEEVTEFATIGDISLFAARTRAEGWALWKTDGTQRGTELVKDLFDQTYEPRNFFVYKDELYFEASDEDFGRKLWKSDGTPDGTVLFENVNEDRVGYSRISNFLVYNDTLYFNANNFDSGNTQYVYRSDGTEEGTIMATELIPSGIGSLKTVANGKIYFTGQEGLYEGNGQEGGTTSVVIDGLQFMSRFTSLNDELYFVTRNYNNTYVRLYRLKSLQEYTMLKEFSTEARNGYNLYGLTEAGNTIFFALGSGEAYRNVRDVLWTTDGTPEGTVELVTVEDSDLFDSGNFTGFTDYNGMLYFSSGGANDYALWSSDGTISGTKEVVTENAANSVSADSPVFVANGKLYFFNAYSLQLISYDDVTNTFLNESILSTGRRSTGDNYFLANDGSTVYFLAANREDQYFFSLDLYTVEPNPIMEVKARWNLKNGQSLPLQTKVDSLITVNVEVRNTGRAPLHFSKVFVSGEGFYVNGAVEGTYYQPNPDDFFPQTLNPFERGFFELGFLPGTVGVHEGYLLIRANEAKQPEFKIKLDGLALEEPPLETVATFPLNKEIVWDTNESAILIDNNSVPKGSEVGTLVGNLSTETTEENFEFEFVAGTGSENNTDFTINGTALLVGDGFNKNLLNSYSIRVKAIGDAGTEIEANLVIGAKEEDTVIDLGSCDKQAESLTSVLYDVDFLNEDIAIAVGAHGTILKTEDKGVSWEQTDIIERTNLVSGFIPYLSRLYKVDFVTDRVGFILGESILLKTENGGNDWIPLELDNLPDYGNIGFKALDENNLLVNHDANIYKSDDGGRTWYLLNRTGLSSFGDHRALYFFNDNFGLVSTSNENYAITNDGGESWTTFELDEVVADLRYDEDITDFHFLDTSTGFASTSRGKVLKTEDGGLTWSIINGEYRPSLSEIYFFDNNRGYIVGNGIFETSDGGVTWNRAEMRHCTEIYGSTVNSTGDRIAVGAGCYANSRNIHYALNSGSWQVASSLIGSDIDALLIDGQDGYLFSSSESKRSSDGGVTWTTMTTPIDEDVAYVKKFGSSILIKEHRGPFYMSNDEGLTWAVLGGGKEFAEFDIVDENTIIAVNELRQFEKSVDAGNSWSLLPGDTMIPKRSVEFVNENVGFTGGIPGLARTLDGGATWQELIVDPNPEFYVYDIAFADTQNGMITTNLGYYRTTDGGDSWAILPFLARYRGKVSIESELSWHVIDGSYIYSSKDGGETWKNIHSSDGGIIGLNLVTGHYYGVNDQLGVFRLIDDLEPLRPGFIKGDDIVFTGNEEIYSVPKHSDTRYSWTLEGNHELISQDNLCRVIWNEPGTYVLQAVPYSSCVTGLSTEFTIQVVEKPNPPIIEGPVEVVENDTNTFYSTELLENTRYLWSVEGATDFSASQNELTVDWGGIGVGEIGLITTDEDTGLRLYSDLQVDILPEDPFTIQHTDATCINKDNGSLRVTSRITGVVYNLDLTYGNTTDSYGFSDELNIDELAPGIYEICITDLNSGKEYCYGFTISEPEPFEVESKIVSRSSKEIALKFNGGLPPYTISLNGSKIAETSQDEISLAVENGDLLEVFASGSCNFSYAEKVEFGAILSIAPNPVVDEFNLELDTRTLPKGANSASIILFDLSGKVVLKEVLPILNNRVSCNISTLRSGVYLVQIGDEEVSSFKIIKE